MSDTSFVTRRSAAARYGAAVLAVALALLGRLALDPLLRDSIPYPFFLLAVTLVAFYGDLGPALLSTVLGFLAADWFFIPPRHSFGMETLGTAVGAGSFFLASLVIILAVHAMHRARAQALSRGRELEAEMAERARAEHAVRAERQRFNDVLNMLPAYVVLLTPDYHVPFANRFFEQRFGESRGRRCFEYLFGRTEPCDICETYTVLKTNAPHHWEWTGPGGRNYDIHDFPFTDTDGSPLILEMGIDITERKQAEAALKDAKDLLEQRVTERTAELAESEERLETVFRTSPTGIFVTRLADGRFLDVNDAYLRIVGYPAEEVVGRSPLALSLWVNPDDRSRIARMLDERGRVESCEVQFRRKSGEVVNLLLSALPLQRGGETCVLGTLTDITELKRAEDALKELNQSLEQRVVERTAEVRRMADQLRALAVELTQAESRERRRLSAVLHDHVQQLLVSAQIQLSMVRRADSESIRSTVQGIESIIKEAVNAARSLAVELSPPVLDQAGLAAGLSWVAKRMEEKSFFKVHVVADHDAEPATEDVRSLLFESVRELLLNALKHSGVPEARVTMESTSDGWTRIIVEDAGKGFDPSILRATTAGDVGFGLFSIQQRLAYNGGRMELESAPGRGTKVSLYAPPGGPAAGEGGAAAMRRSDEAVRLSERSKKIHVLIVDDHKIMRQGLVGMLQFEPDIEIVGEAGDGQQAVDLAREHRPDVVIMDVNLPVMNGVEATKILAKELPQTKIIGLSMHIDPAVAESMRRAGAVAYLTKEDLSQDLVAAIRACAARDRA